MFDYSTKSFLDIKIIDDLALQFDLERQNSFKHFVYYCLNKSNQKERHPSKEDIQTSSYIQ